MLLLLPKCSALCRFWQRCCLCSHVWMAMSFHTCLMGDYSAFSLHGLGRAEPQQAPIYQPGIRGVASCWRPRNLALADWKKFLLWMQISLDLVTCNSPRFLMCSFSANKASVQKICGDFRATEPTSSHVDILLCPRIFISSIISLQEPLSASVANMHFHAFSLTMTK